MPNASEIERQDQEAQQPVGETCSIDEAILRLCAAEVAENKTYEAMEDARQAWEAATKLRQTRARELQDAMARRRRELTNG